jgi:outer membrane protein assembly factor BamE (lipoprotein component of BamABCDE complex)
MAPRIALLLFLALSLLTGCSISDRRDGVPNRWQARAAEFRPGVTREKDVLEILGPPSEVIDIGSRTVFYYLLEETHSEALSLILITKAETRVRYDRAIFFFLPDGTLEQFSLSPRPLEPDPVG